MKRMWLSGIAVAAVTWTSVSLAEDPPEIDPRATPTEHDSGVFGPDPDYLDDKYDFNTQLDIYGGKFEVQTPRPFLELGQELYTAGPFRDSYSFLGELNPVLPSLYVFGDVRTAVAFNDNGKNELAQIATRINADIDFKITATERIHAFIGPLDSNGGFTRCEIGGGDAGVNARGCKAELDLNLDALFFEGDLGAIRAGMTGEYNNMDLPFAFGLMPLLFQNGVWVEDAFTGFAFTFPALNSADLDISNLDLTFFAGFDKVSSGGVLDREGKVADHNVHLYGLTAFLEANQGYWELGYGFTDGKDGLASQDYHNLTAAFTRRYGGWLSNSVRVIFNIGQERQEDGFRNATGTLLLIENSLITSLPSTLVPYFNLFMGIGSPQSLARAAGAGGVLKNTGINFETDGLTGFPKLEDTANNTFGGALGVSYLFNLDQQLVAEFATVQTIGGDFTRDRKAKGEEYALGLRYQLPLDKAWILRADAMYGWRTNDDDIGGARLEIRRKF